MKNNILKNSCVSCLLILYMLFSFSFPSFAKEDYQELAFNSVIEIESYSIDGGYIEAGKEANITLTIRNSNLRSTANSIVVSVLSESKMIYPTYGNDNSFFVGMLTPGKSATVNIPLVASSDLKSEFVDLICNITYACNDKQVNNSSVMVLPVKGNEAITVSSVDVSAHATVNGKSLLSIRYNNNSDENINDAILLVEGNITESSKSIELGTVAAGKSYTKDYNIIFTTPGEQDISIFLSYPDENGEKVKSELGRYTVNVGEETETERIASTENSNLDIIGKVIAALALFAAFVTVCLYIWRR